VPSDSLSTRTIASRSCLLALGWIGITAALFGIGQFVVHSHAITDFDRNVTNWVVNHRTPPLNATMKAITWIGSWVAVAVTGGVVLVLTLAKRLTIAHLLMLAVAWAGEYTIVNLTKYAVGRPRPPKDLWLVTAHGASFPSGHAANATLVCIAASLVAFLFSLRLAVRAATVTLAGLVIAAVGFSRVELGVHWTTDVIFGSLVTMVWLAVMVRVFATTVPLTVPGPPGNRPGIGGPLSDSMAGMR
jgi:membrane-associated phospholipid phosphatase